MDGARFQDGMQLGYTVPLHNPVKDIDTVTISCQQGNFQEALDSFFLVRAEF